MTTGSFDRRTLGMLIGGVLLILVLRALTGGDGETAVVQATSSIPLAERRLTRLRQTAAALAGKEAVLKQVRAELAEREKGMVQTVTAPQAQAQLLETLRGLAQKEGIDVRGAEEMRVRQLANDYGEVFVAVSFNCTIEQLVNLLAALTAEPVLVATNELRVSAANQKQKTLQVRLGVSGVVPRKLAPEKKGIPSF